MPKKTYTDEFKTDAVNYYYDSGLSINTTAKKLGVSVSALRKWIKLSKKRWISVEEVEIILAIKIKRL